MELHLEIYWSTRNDFTDDIFHACHMKCWSHKFCVTFSLFTCGGGTGGGGGDGCWMRSFLILLCLVRASVSVCVCLSQMNWIHIDRINFIFRNFENPTTVGAKMAMICMRCDYVCFFFHRPTTPLPLQQKLLTVLLTLMLFQAVHDLFLDYTSHQIRWNGFYVSLLLPLPELNIIFLLLHSFGFYALFSMFQVFFFFWGGWPFIFVRCANNGSHGVHK